MLDEFAILRQTRTNVLNYVKGMDDARLTAIPAGLKNNILWNLGHLVVTPQLLLYKLSGQPMKIDEALVDTLRKGTSPAGWTTPPDRAFLQEKLLATVDEIEADYQAGLFSDYKPYATSYGVELTSAQDALAFNNVHEGLHFGTIRAINGVLG